MAGQQRANEKAGLRSADRITGIRYRGRRHEKFLPGNGEDEDQRQESVHGLYD